MRYILLAIFCFVAPQLSMAQSHKSLEIDATSFAPIQSGALSGVAIDKISPDVSNRPCARIKLHINRMSRDEIANLSVKTIGGNIVVMRREVAYEGNGLIIELTAKEHTRFYLHHDKYGDSNEVSLNLEGNKEYKLDAQLSLLQSIVVSTNIAGANVYIDDIYKGQTNDGAVLTINDVTHGAHKIRVEYGVAKSEQQVEVSSSNIHFRVDVNHALSRPQYVVFEVYPRNASVVIDSKSQIPDPYGLVQVVLNNGTYEYSISAKDFHTESGTFVVKGEKVEKTIRLQPAHGWLKVLGTEALEGASVFVDGSLIGTAPITSDKLASGTHSVRIVKNLYKSFDSEVIINDNETLEYDPQLIADFAHITLNAGGDYGIYVNDEYKGKSPWSGEIGTGTYIFEARKDGHRTTSISQTIAAEPQKQSYTIPAPTPIIGTLNLTSTPAMATVLIDNKEVGRTPLMKDLIIGRHSIAIRKEGYRSENRSVVIQEGETASLSVTLSEQENYSSPSYSSNSSSSSKASYSSSSDQSNSYNKKYKKHRPWDSFNLGVQLGVGYELIGGQPEINTGILFRMWRHDSMFNAMTGATYMRTNGFHYLGFPAVVNWNMMRELGSASMYLGLGTEVTLSFENYYYDKSILTDFPLVFQWGVGWRHSDFNFYIKYFSGYDLAAMGIRYAYLF